LLELVKGQLLFYGSMGNNIHKSKYGSTKKPAVKTSAMTKTRRTALGFASMYVATPPATPAITLSLERLNGFAVFGRRARRWSWVSPSGFSVML
jgi:hypothetical protein